MLLLSIVIIVLWAFFAFYIFRTVKASLEKQQSALRKMLRFVFVAGGMAWTRNPKILSNPEKTKKKKEKLFARVRYLSIAIAITAILLFIIGIANVSSNFQTFLFFSFTMAPFAGFSATYYFFLWKLMKKLDYVDSEI